MIWEAAQQADAADEAFGGMVARTDMPPHAPAGGMDGGTASQLIRSVSPTLGWRRGQPAELADA